MRGSNINLKFVHRAVPLIGALHRWSARPSTSNHMRKTLNNEIAGCVVVLCLALFSSLSHAAPFVEISAEIETYGYQLEDTNSIARAKQKTVHVTCVTGASEWFIEEDFSSRRLAV
jgi:hypothetical protein